MAEPRQNTWTTDEWYEQNVAGNVRDYSSTEQLWAWGANQQGQFGSMDNTNRSSPVPIPGNWYACSFEYGGVGMKKDNKGGLTFHHLGGRMLGNGIQDWRRFFAPAADKDSHSMLPAGAYGHSSPVQIPGSYKQISQGLEAAFAIKSDGTLWSWGTGNQRGHLGYHDYGYEPASYSPKQIGLDTDWRWVTGGHELGMAIKNDGTLWVWGRNDFGQLGQGEGGNWPSYSGSRSSPVQIPGTTWKSVQANQTGCIGTKTDGTAWSWGRNEYGYLMQNDEIARSSPTQIGTDTDWDTPINDMRNAAGSTLANSAVFMLKKNNGNVFACGLDSQSAFAMHGHDPRFSSPIELGYNTSWAGFCEDKNFKYVHTVGAYHSMLGVTPGGELWAWGQGEMGELGQNSRTSRSSPVQIPGTWSTTRFPGSGGDASSSVCWWK